MELQANNIDQIEGVRTIQHANGLYSNTNDQSSSIIYQENKGNQVFKLPPNNLHHHHHQSAGNIGNNNQQNCGGNASIVTSIITANSCTPQFMLVNPNQQQNSYLYADDDEDDSRDIEEDDDVSNESVAERKILKIDRRLTKNRQVIDKTQKRRLQNRKSALKCRLRKSHLIATLQNEVSILKTEKQGLFQEILKLKDRLKEEQLNNSALIVELTKLQSQSKGMSNADGMTTQMISNPIQQQQEKAYNQSQNINQLTSQQQSFPVIIAATQGGSLPQTSQYNNVQGTIQMIHPGHSTVSNQQAASGNIHNAIIQQQNLQQLQQTTAILINPSGSLTAANPSSIVQNGSAGKQQQAVINLGSIQVCNPTTSSNNQTIQGNQLQQVQTSQANGLQQPLYQSFNVSGTTHHIQQGTLIQSNQHSSNQMQAKVNNYGIVNPTPNTINLQGGQITQQFIGGVQQNSGNTYIQIQPSQQASINGNYIQAPQIQSNTGMQVSIQGQPLLNQQNSSQFSNQAQQMQVQTQNLIGTSIPIQTQQGVFQQQTGTLQNYQMIVGSGNINGAYLGNNGVSIRNDQNQQLPYFSSQNLTANRQQVNKQ